MKTKVWAWAGTWTEITNVVVCIHAWTHVWTYIYDLYQRNLWELQLQPVCFNKLFCKILLSVTETQHFQFHIYVHACEKVSYLMCNFPKLCCSFYESSSPPYFSSMSPTFALSFSFSLTPYIVLEEEVTFRQGEENRLPTNIGTKANKSQEGRARGQSGSVSHGGLGKAIKNNKPGWWYMNWRPNSQSNYPREHRFSGEFEIP